MRKVILFGGLALCICSCSDSGSGAMNKDSTHVTDNRTIVNSGGGGDTSTVNGGSNQSNTGSNMSNGGTNMNSGNNMGGTDTSTNRNQQKQ